MTPRRTVEDYVRRHNARLTVMENREHWFHTPVNWPCCGHGKKGRPENGRMPDLSSAAGIPGTGRGHGVRGLSQKEPSKTRCVNGHYVCSDCHTQGMDSIFGLCLSETSADPWPSSGG